MIHLSFSLMKRLVILATMMTLVLGTAMVSNAAETVKKVVVQKKPAPKPVAKKTPTPPKAAVKPAPKAATKPTTYSVASSQATFSIGETLRGAPFTAVGATSEVTGEVSFDWVSPEKSTLSAIKINARTFKTESGSRDSMIRKFILKAEDPANEYIVFKSKSISGLPKTLKEGQQLSLVIRGDLMIAGVTKETQFTGSAIVTKKALSGNASTTIKRADYNIIVPSVPFVASVDEEVKLSINLNGMAK